MPENISNQIKIKKAAPGDVEIISEWSVPEYTEHRRNLNWYIIMIIIALGLIIYSIATGNFLFALIIILAVFITFIREYSGMQQIKFSITDRGVMLGNQFFEYKKINNFYIIYEPPAVKKLFFDLKGIGPNLSIPLLDQNPILIRKMLLEYLEEDVEREQQNIDDQLETIFKL